MVCVKPEIAVAQLSIVDGAWQESPDYVAQFDQAVLFADGLARGSLYVVVEVAGEPEGRDQLARELIETARREYAASRGSIALGLIQAVRAANAFFYDFNANTPPAARRIAGMTAAIVRDDELFIAQAGPGLTCLARADELRRYPEDSPWFNPDQVAVLEWLGTRTFPTPGAVPMGMRRNYTPDQFHATLLPGDVVVLATRSLAALLTERELLDTLARRHPEDIVANLEDLAGTTDLSAIVLQAPSESPAPPRAAIEPTAAAPIFAPLPDEEEFEPTPAFVPAPPAPSSDAARGQAIEEEPAPRGKPSAELQWQQHARAERRHQVIETSRTAIQRAGAGIAAVCLRVGAGSIAALAALFSRINWHSIGTATDRAIDAIWRAFARSIVFVIRTITPSEPSEARPSVSTPRAQTAWKLAAFALPILLIATGSFAWISYHADQQRLAALETQRLVQESTNALENAKRLATSDPAAARASAQKALTLAQQARARDPHHQAARTAYYQAEDWLEQFSGVAILYTIHAFATLSDDAQPPRLAAHASDVFILDRGAQRVYRYTISESEPGATPVGTDGVILKAGDRVDNRATTQFFDMVLLETGRLVVFDRSGLFLQYDVARSEWSARPATDATAWARATLAGCFTTNLYLADPTRNQIYRYTANNEGWWTSPVTYFMPDVNPDLSNLVDLTLDENVWLLRGDSSIFRYTRGRPSDWTVRDLDKPLVNPVAIVTSPQHIGLYIADAGNQRIVQIDKTNGKFARQFKPRSESREVFQSLQALAVDEASRRFYFVSGHRAYLATIPQ